MAALIYAVPPVIRLVETGIRTVPTTVVEAATAAGSTQRQLLWKVELPMAKAALLVAANQGIVLVLAMVVVGGLVGAGGLGFDVVAGFSGAPTTARAPRRGSRSSSSVSCSTGSRRARATRPHRARGSPLRARGSGCRDHGRKGNQVHDVASFRRGSRTGAHDGGGPEEHDERALRRLAAAWRRSPGRRPVTGGGTVGAAGD